MKSKVALFAPFFLRALFLLAFCFGAVSAFALIRYVKPAAAGTGDGSSWANASADLQAMINASAAGDTVWVAAGTYKPAQDPSGNSNPADPRDKSFYLKSGVKVFGGFAGTESALGQRDIGANPSILSGDFNGDDVVSGSGASLSFSNNGENAYHVVVSISDDNSTLLDGFTITGGNANGEGGFTAESQYYQRYIGAGLVAFGSSLSIRNCTFSGNSAGGVVGGAGGAFYFFLGSPQLNNCTILHNKADAGGGFYGNNCTATIKNCVFYGNKATFGSAADIDNYGSATFTHCTIAGNGTQLIGVLYSDFFASLSVVNSIIWDNIIGGGYGAMVTGPNATMAASYSLIQNQCCISGPGLVFGQDPLFVNAGNPAGPDGIHRTADDGLWIPYNSPAINAGDPGITDPPADITGFTRTGVFDAGAYENSCPSGLGPVFYVKPVASGTGDGSSWANAAGDLQAAIDNLDIYCRTEIWVAAGTYKPTQDQSGDQNPADPRTKTFILKSGIKLYGGFAGTENDPDERNITGNPTILSGDFNDDDVITGSGPSLSISGNDENAYQVAVYHADLLDGFTISGGNGAQGGGLLYAGNKMYNCTFYANSASQGGAIALIGGAPVIANCIFLNNQAGIGSGIYVPNFASLEMFNCSFSGNKADNGTFANIQLSGFSSIDNCIFWGNSSAIFNDPGNWPANINYSIVQGGYPGTGNLDADPLFVSPMDLRLQLCSPAVNAGANASVPGDLTVDLDGNPRIFNNGTVDMGAFEFQASSVIPSAYTVSGGGSDCENNAIAPVTLSGSQAGISYQWKIDGVNQGSPVPGTGTALDFGPLSASGQYTVVATSADGCTAGMEGSANVAFGEFEVTLGAANALTGQPMTITTNPGNLFQSIEWRLNGITVATGTSTMYIPNQCGTWTAFATNSTGCTAMSNELEVLTRWYADSDADGFGDPAVYQDACPQPVGFVLNDKDCDDANNTVHPGATEICNDGLDNNCDGKMLELTAPLVQPASVEGCVGEMVTLSVPSPAGAIQWYDAPIGGNLVTTGTEIEVTLQTSMTLYAQSPPLQYTRLSGVNTAVALAIAEHNELTGDDGRGIAVTPDYVFYTGDDNTARYDHNLENGIQLPRIDGMFSDLASGRLYAFRYGSDFASNAIDRIQPLDAMGQADGAPILLSQPLTNLGIARSILFNGFGYVLFYDYTSKDLFRIALPSGNVTVIKEDFNISDHRDAEAYWSWYMSEFDGVDYSVVYRVQGQQMLVRINLTTLQKDTVVTFTDIGSDAAQFVFSPWDNRLFVHNEGGNAYNSNTNGEWLFVFEATNSIQCTEAPRTEVLLTILLPTASVSAATSPICAGENAVFNLTGTANAEVTYNINGGGNQTVNLDINGEAAVTVNSATTNQTLALVSVRNTTTNCAQNLSASAVVAVSSVASASILYVNAAAPNGGDGLSWGTAFNKLQDALTLAGQCAGVTEIWVAQGAYKPDQGAGYTPGNRSHSFVMKNGVAIYGGFNGTESLRSQRNWVANVTTLSGDIGTTGNNSDNSYHVIANSGLNSTAVLDGFSITGGNANGGSFDSFGGGMSNIESSPAVTNCSFSGNSASNGGSMFNIESSPAVTNCSFSGNSADGFGGGMYNIYSSPAVINCSFFGNSAGGGGGGMFNSFAPPTVTNCIIWGNSSGIVNESIIATAIVIYSIVQGGYVGAGNLNINPLFVDASNGNLRLQSCSPAINSGSNAAVPSGITTDLDGNPRFFNSGTVDMGAYEFQGDLAVITLSDPSVTQPTCATPTGTIVVNATSSETLEYSVDNGSNWQLSATFSGLAPGNYYITVRLQANTNCEATYASNPVVLDSPFSATTTDTWTGCVSTDWATPGNWQDGTVPTASDDVTIPNVTNDPVVMAGTTAVANSVYVQSNGSLTIQNTGSLIINGFFDYGNSITSGFRNQGTVANSGQVVLGSTGSVGRFGIWNQAAFNNNSGGEISIDQSSVAGLWNNSGTFSNAAKITIGAIAGVGSEGIRNEAAFHNNTCAEIYQYAPLFNNNAFTNGGLMLVSTTGTHSNTTLTNNGIIAYPQGNPIPNVTNNEIIVASTTANDCESISPAFSLGSPLDFTIVGIFTDANATLSAGSYNAATNTFTPTATLPEDTYNYFVKIEDGSGGCTRIVPWQLTTENCCDAPEALCKPATVYLNAEGQATLAVAEVDNGSTADCGLLSIALSASQFDCSQAGPQMVTLTVTDINNDSSQCMATVTVVDNTPPSITCPAAQMLVLGSACTATLPDYTGMATVSENCGVQSVAQSPAAGTTVSGAGPMAVMLTVTDINGLTDTCSFTVNKVDDTPPNLICRTTTIFLDPTGNYSLLDTDVLNFDASTDNCSAITVTDISPSDFNCDDLMQTFDVLVTAQDDSGNSSSCIASITVFEGTALPQPWAGIDVGNPGTGNTYQYSPCSQPPIYTVQAGAANNSQTGDNLATIAQTLCDDFSIEVKIEAVTPNGWAGLMVRESGTPGSKMLGMYSNLGSIVRWESRSINNANKSISLFSRPFPYWLRLVRQGNFFVGYYSSNGISYSIVNIQSLPLGSCLEVGVAAFTSLPGQAATAVFSQLAVSGGASPLSIAPGSTLEPAQAERAARLWPNPTREAFTLELPAAAGETRLRLLNQLGQPLEERLLPAGKSQLEWQVGHLPAGVYFVEVLADGPAAEQDRTVLRLVRVE
jgi:hypothetical protein